ncbi:MAG: DUF4105 domain-containing protein [Bacteroidetes bacterium]|nr:DUF4105 domain-containing protein [Bacteroidota bacterium]
MKQYFLRVFIAAYFIVSATCALAVELSDSARVSLLTCAPGNELYSCFGHSGIRVTDYRQGFDVVFNYGTFDYGAPNFYLNFLKGHMIYMIGVDSYRDFYESYVYEGRSVYEQVLNLNDSQRVRIFDFLVNNAKPENRNYRYDFLWDNCATRIRDVFEKNIPGVSFDYSTFTDKKSFRTLINDYSEEHPWEQFGMGLLIGLPVDRTATPREETFLPDYLSEAFAHATIGGRPLAGPRETLLDVKPSGEKTLDQKITPVMVFGALLLLIVLVTIYEVKRGKYFYAIDIVLLFLAGFFGWQFLLLGGFTEHTTTQWNLNILWALPTHLFMAFLAPFVRGRRWVQYYFLVSAVLASIIVIGWKLLPQHFLLANILIAAIFAIRSYHIYRVGKLSS